MVNIMGDTDPAPSLASDDFKYFPKMSRVLIHSMVGIKLGSNRNSRYSFTHVSKHVCIGNMFHTKHCKHYVGKGAPPVLLIIKLLLFFTVT